MSVVRRRQLTLDTLNYLSPVRRHVSGLQWVMVIRSLKLVFIIAINYHLLIWEKVEEQKDQVTLLLIWFCSGAFLFPSIHSSTLFCSSCVFPITLIQSFQTNLKSGKSRKMTFSLGFQAREIFP